MTTYLPRSAWTKTGPAKPLARMPSRPKGIAVHWPGTTAPIGHRSQANMAARLEGYRRFHVSGRGWSDIAYGVGIDQDGRVWDLRGIEYESAANGDQSVNRTYLACLFLLGPGEQPSDALRQAFTDWRSTRALKRYPTATRIVGHRDIRPGGGTDCPGPITEGLIKAGQLLGDNDMDDKDARVLWGYDQQGKLPRDAWAILRSAEAKAAASLGIVKALAAKTMTADEIQAAAKAGAADALGELIDSATVVLQAKEQA